jgi:hypothetical protein
MKDISPMADTFMRSADNIAVWDAAGIGLLFKRFYSCCSHPDTIPQQPHGKSN